MNHEYVILSAVHLLCVCTRTVYELLKEKGIANPRNNVLFLFIFLVMCGLWTTWFALCPIDPDPLVLPLSVHWLGVLIAVSGTVLAVGALVQLKGLENIDHLVTRGMYSRIRHPMYVGFLAWIVGWSMYHASAISFALGLVTAANILYWRSLEERRLVIQFGESYAVYRRSTWF